MKPSFSPLLIGVILIAVIVYTNAHLRPLLTVFGFVIALTGVNITGSVIACLVARVSIKEISMFYGKKIVELTVNGVRVSLGIIPTGGYVSIKGLGDDDTVEPKGDSFQSRGWGWKLIILLSGPIAQWVLACFCVGPSHALHSLATGFYQYPLGAFSPLSYGQALLHMALIVYSTKGFLFTLGILLTKMAAWSLLPFGSTGRNAISTLVNFKDSNRFRDNYLMFSVFSDAIVLLGWCIAFGKFAFAQHQ